MATKHLPDHTAIQFQQDNPKRKGSQAHARYEKYKGARSVGEALRLGAVKGDIPNDIQKGVCSVDDAAAIKDAATAAVAGVSSAAPSPSRPPQAPTAAVAGEVASPGKRSGADEAAGGGPQEVLRAPSPKKRDANQAACGADAAAPAAKRPALETPAARGADAFDAATPLAKRPALESPPAAPQQVQPQQLAGSCAATASSSTGNPAKAPCELTTSVSSSATPQGRAASYEVDLSFADFHGKPMKFMKRAMGEARRVLSERGLAENHREGLDFSLSDRVNLAKYAVRVGDLNQDGQLYKDLKKHGLDAGIDLEVSLPDGFPLDPPFVRVVYPQLTGGFVFTHGGICFEPLTAKGWAPSMTLPALCISIKGILDYGEVRVSGVGNKETRTIPHYTEDGARKDSKAISNAHQGGDSRTYMRNIKS